MFDSFPPEVADKLGYYVYRLIDPRDGQTFYVGKGKGNRVFRHAQGVAERERTEEAIGDNDPQKLRVIHGIHEEGLEVIHVIQRWGLKDEDTAFEVEAALIDCYRGLTNLQAGHGSDDYGVANAASLIRRFTRKVYDEPKDFRYLLIKVQQWRVDEAAGTYGNDARYQITRWCWKIKPRSTEEYPYAFSVTGGIVKEVYKIDRWIPAEEKRYAFEGSVAEEAVRHRFVDKRIPDAYCKKGMASPVLFSKNELTNE